jgi:hypothetical protein
MTRVFSVLLDPPQYAKLARLAAAAGVKRGELVRRLILSAEVRPPEVTFTEVESNAGGERVHA